MKKTPLKAKQSLRAAKSLQAKPKQRKKRRPSDLSKCSAQQLVKIADGYFSKYIRLRDSSSTASGRVGTCISCSRQLTVIDAEGKWNPSAQNGHYVSRGNHETRFDEENCNLQCAHCNAWRDKIDMINAYRAGLEDKYGDGTADKLEAMPKRYAPHKDELLQVIADSKEAIQFYLGE